MKAASDALQEAGTTWRRGRTTRDLRMGIDLRRLTSGVYDGMGELSFGIPDRVRCRGAGLGLELMKNHSYPYCGGADALTEISQMVKAYRGCPRPARRLNMS